MFGYFRSLPNQPLSARRRFVIFATAFSFALIVLLWVGVVTIGRPPEPAATPASVPEGELPEAPLLSPSPGPGEPVSPEVGPTQSPAPTAPVDFGDISASLIRVFAPLPESP